MRPFLLALLLALPSPLLAGNELDPLRTVAVQDGGRVKPLDTFARETARRVGGARAFGAESIAGLEPVSWMVAMIADPDHWKDVPMIRVTQAELRNELGLPDGRDRFSFTELVGNTKVHDGIDRIRAREAAGGDTKLTSVEEALSSLYGTLSLVSGIFSTESLRVIPPPAGTGDTWLSVGDAQKAGSGARARLLMVGLLSAVRGGDAGQIRTAADALAYRLAKMARAGDPAMTQLDREVAYNRLKPFRLAWMLYMLGAAAVLGALALKRSPRGALLLVVLGWGVHSYGLVLRSLISGRPPVTNMYESVVFVAWGAVLFALLLEWAQRSGYAAASAAVLAIACLVIADSVPIMDGSIAPLVPVLRDNFWLTTHVLTISLGYAALMLATGIAHIVLGLWFFAPGRAVGSNVPRLLYRALQAGTLLLAAGTLLGGIWASYAWGRFWGWDPKETWALIALLGYLSLLHGRSAGLLRDFGLAVAAIVAFLGVLMAWYGVNFVLGTGLHSYGFGAGGSAYIGAFAAAEVALAAIALVVAHRRSAAAHPAPGALPART